MGSKDKNIVSKQITPDRWLSNKETWNNIQIGDLIQTEYLDGRRDAFIVKEIKEGAILTMKLRTGYSHTIFKASCAAYWVS